MGTPWSSIRVHSHQKGTALSLENPYSILCHAHTHTAYYVIITFFDVEDNEEEEEEEARANSSMKRHTVEVSHMAISSQQ